MLINKIFSYLPIVCLIDNQILCVNSGISKHVMNFEYFNKLKLPLENSHNSIG